MLFGELFCAFRCFWDELSGTFRCFSVLLGELFGAFRCFSVFLDAFRSFSVCFLGDAIWVSFSVIFGVFG